MCSVNPTKKTKPRKTKTLFKKKQQHFDRSLNRGRKISVGVFQFMLQLMLCKEKVQKLFESLECLRIQAAKSDVGRLYSQDNYVSLSNGPPKNDSRKQ